MLKKRIVITGLGLITPLGNDVSTSWNNLLDGQSGVSEIDLFDTSHFPVKIAAMVKNFNAEEYLSKKDQKKMDLFIQYGIGASIQAIRDAQIEVNDDNRHRIGVAVGAGIGGLPLIESNCAQYLKSGPRRISPFFIPSTIINMISGNLSVQYGFTGPNISIVTACTTGVHNIGHAARMIDYGDADIMIAGGSEMATTPLGIGGFASARALSTRNDEPTKASRPWDKDRDGFVMGEGAGVLVLEEYEHAKKRGAKIYAELLGFGMSGDAYHMTSPSPNGEGAAAAMANTLKDANIPYDAIDYINAHGTSTPAGDIVEVKAVKNIFQNHAYNLVMSSTKSMTGHLLGAAGAVETIFTALSIKDQKIPPTINLDTPDEGCDLDFNPGGLREMHINYALCNSFGFGGTNGSILLKKYE